MESGEIMMFLLDIAEEMGYGKSVIEGKGLDERRYRNHCIRASTVGNIDDDENA